ncbi:reverse transcriptase domain-containing protein [Tanacetum coccineum]
MANGTNISTSKNRGCGAFKLHMDEFCGGEITISLQWDHRKARVRKIQAVPSTAYGMLKIPVPGGILTLRSSRIIPLEGSATPSGTSPERPRRMTSSQTKEKKPSTRKEQGKIQVEVEKLVDAKIMKGVNYHSWLSNLYPLLEIDWKVESLFGYPFKCFLDAYKGYHQIKIAKEDEEKTAFITSQGIFCYSKMPFGLKNAGETYQQFADKALQKKIGRNLEVYVDDLVIKNYTEQEIMRDIEETFMTL